MKTVASRWLTPIAVIILLLVGGIQVANPHSYLSEVVARVGEAGSGPDASLTDLNAIDRLKVAFNRGGIWQAGFGLVEVGLSSAG